MNDNYITEEKEKEELEIDLGQFYNFFADCKIKLNTVPIQ